MKPLLKIVFFLCVMPVLLAACGKDNIPSGYEGKPGLFLNVYNLEDDKNGAFFIRDDSAHYRFAYSPANTAEVTVLVAVQLLGAPAGKDRTFKLVISPAESTALPSEYQLPDSFVLPADKSVTNIPVVLKRSDRLTASEICITLHLISTPEFMIDSDKFQTAGERTSFRIFWSDILTKPVWWGANSALQSIGKYSRVKHRFILDALRITPFELENFLTIDPVTGRILAVNNSSLVTTLSNPVFFLKFLDTYNAANPGNPLRNEFGEEIGFCSTCN